MMTTLDAAQAAHDEISRDIGTLEARLADITRQHAAAIAERDEAAGAAARSIVDGAGEKARSALIGSQVKAEATVSVLEMARDEAAARLEHLGADLAKTRAEVTAARERDEYKRSAAALHEFADRLVEGLEELAASIPPRHRNDVEDVLRLAIAEGLRPDRARARLVEWAAMLRRRAGLDRPAIMPLSIAPPLPHDSGVVVFADVRFKNVDGTEVTVESEFVGNLPAAAVALIVDRSLGKALGPRPSFRTVRMLRDHVDDLGDRNHRRYESDELMSLPAAVAVRLTVRCFEACNRSTTC